MITRMARACTVPVSVTHDQCAYVMSDIGYISVARSRHGMVKCIIMITTSTGGTRAQKCEKIKCESGILTRTSIVRDPSPSAWCATCQSQASPC